MIKKGVYAASLSVMNADRTLNIDATIAHASQSIQSGLHGIFFFGSTGQSQLISTNEKKELISKIASNKLKKNFFLGTGNNSLNENIDIVKYAMEYDFKEFLIMPPAYYKGNTDEGVFDFYSRLISAIPKVKIILYNFEKLSGYKFSEEAVIKLVKTYPENIIGCKDSSYNLYENLKLPNFLMFPGSESKLLKGLELGCTGIITATCNATAFLARNVFEDFFDKKEQKYNNKLCNVRKIFDQFNLISGLHSFFSDKYKSYKNLLPPLDLLNKNDKNKLIKSLDKIGFNLEKINKF